MNELLNLTGTFINQVINFIEYSISTIFYLPIFDFYLGYIIILFIILSFILSLVLEVVNND